MKRLLLILIILSLVMAGCGQDEPPIVIPADGDIKAERHLEMGFAGDVLVPTRFSSSEKLDSFLKGYKFNLAYRMQYTDEDFSDWDCDDYSMDLFFYSIERGKAIYPQWARKGDEWNDRKLSNHHLGNATIIGNEFYLIEPTSCDYWLFGYLD